MPGLRTAKVQEEIIREVANRARKKARLFYDYLTEDGYLPGETPRSEQEELFFYQKYAQYLPQEMERNPKHAAKILRRIEALTRTQ